MQVLNFSISLHWSGILSAVITVGIFFLFSPYYVFAVNQPNLSVFNTEVGGILFVGQELTLSGLIKNTGDVAVDSTTVARFTVNDRKVEDVNVPALAPGESFDARVRWIAQSGGAHRMRLCADTTSLVAESSEGDNCSTDYTITVSSGGPVGTPQASVIFPGLGAQWRVGETRRIDWTLFNYTKNFSIVLAKGNNNRQIKIIVENLYAATRAFNWLIEGGIQPANDYKIILYDNRAVKLAESKFFTISAALPPTLVRAKNSENVYRIINGKRLLVPTPQALTAQGLQFEDVVEQDEPQVINVPRLRLMRARGDTKVYFITSSGLKRWVRTADVFNSYNNKWEDVIEVDSAVVSSLNDSNLLRMEGDTRVYKIEDGHKRWITSAAAFEREGHNWNLIAPANATELNSYETGAPIN